MPDIKRDGEIKPRPGMKLDFPVVPEGETILRIEMFRTLNRKRWQFWKDKYRIQYFALTKKGVYDVTENLNAK